MELTWRTTPGENSLAVEIVHEEQTVRVWYPSYRRIATSRDHRLKHVSIRSWWDVLDLALPSGGRRLYCPAALYAGMLRECRILRSV